MVAVSAATGAGLPQDLRDRAAGRRVKLFRSRVDRHERVGANDVFRDVPAALGSK